MSSPIFISVYHLQPEHLRDEICLPSACQQILLFATITFKSLVSLKGFLFIYSCCTKIETKISVLLLLSVCVCLRVALFVFLLTSNWDFVLNSRIHILKKDFLYCHNVSSPVWWAVLGRYYSVFNSSHHGNFMDLSIPLWYNKVKPSNSS